MQNTFSRNSRRAKALYSSPRLRASAVQLVFSGFSPCLSASVVGFGFSLSLHYAVTAVVDFGFCFRPFLLSGEIGLRFSNYNLEITTYKFFLWNNVPDSC